MDGITRGGLPPVSPYVTPLPLRNVRTAHSAGRPLS